MSRRREAEELRRAIYLSKQTNISPTTSSDAEDSCSPPQRLLRSSSGRDLEESPPTATTADFLATPETRSISTSSKDLENSHSLRGERHLRPDEGAALQGIGGRDEQSSRQSDFDSGSDSDEILQITRNAIPYRNQCKEIKTEVHVEIDNSRVRRWPRPTSLSQYQSKVPQKSQPAEGMKISGAVPEKHVNVATVFEQGDGGLGTPVDYGEREISCVLRCESKSCNSQSNTKKGELNNPAFNLEQISGSSAPQVEWSPSNEWQRVPKVNSSMEDGTFFNRTARLASDYMKKGIEGSRDSCEHSPSWSKGGSDLEQTDNPAKSIFREKQVLSRGVGQGFPGSRPAESTKILRDTEGPFREVSSRATTIQRSSFAGKPLSLVLSTSSSRFGSVRRPGLTKKAAVPPLLNHRAPPPPPRPPPPKKKCKEDEFGKGGQESDVLAEELWSPDIQERAESTFEEDEVVQDCCPWEQE